MSRSTLLAKIRRLCAGSRTSEALKLPSALPAFPRFQDPVAKFAEELNRVGGIFKDARQEGSLAAALTAVLQETETPEIYWENRQVFEKHGIPFTLRNPEAFARGQLIHSFHHRAEVKFPMALNSRAYQRQALADIRLSISSALYGVAETGTILHQVGNGNGRLLSVLPPVHVVLLSESDLLMNHSDLFNSLNLETGGSFTTMVTGPSRTADIEKTLVLGVHGPQFWYVILTL